MARLFHLGADGQPRLVAVHIRSFVKNDGGTCGHDDQERLPNMGVQLAKSLEDRIAPVPENRK
jgi:hypothetical protein